MLIECIVYDTRNKSQDDPKKKSWGLQESAVYKITD